MGVTHYVSISTAEYALWRRLEGQAIVLGNSTYSYDSAKKCLRETLAALAVQQNGKR